MLETELLSPAGSYDSVIAAARFGADAVYMGGSAFQMRSESVGFSIEQIQKSVRFLHSNNKKAYITVNTVLHEKDLQPFISYIDELKAVDPDGIIVADIGAVSLIRKKWNGIPIILSTQANVLNSISANQYFDLGVSRIVLAREMNIKEIRSLRDNTDPRLSLEAFVHGSMCMAYSGRCLLSSFLLGRSANEGECAQPCRWEYRLEEKKRPGQFFPIEQNNDFSLILSSKDLCMIEHLSALKDAGVTSFKIEGRMKTEYYTANVTNAYRMALDSLAPLSVCKSELEKVSHRPYTSGFYFNELPDEHYNDGLYVQDWSYCGKVLACENGCLVIEQHNKFSVGDDLEVLSPGKVGQHIHVESMLDTDGILINTANHPLMIVKLPCAINFSQGDMLRKRII